MQKSAKVQTKKGAKTATSNQSNYLINPHVTLKKASGAFGAGMKLP
jgi:hypothetical protein